MTQVTIEAHPDAAHLTRLGVENWPEWEKETSEFPWQYVENETSYLLEGRAIITPEGGPPIEIGKGNLVTFPSELICVWKIIEPLRKRYRIGSHMR